MRIRNDSVTVLGAGHGGLALAGYLARRGLDVTLWNRSAERVAAVEELGGLRLTLPGERPVFTPITAVTTDLEVALSGARQVLVALPACAHAGLARDCAPHLRDGQTVLLLPGRTGGALEFRGGLRQAGCRARVLLGEANTFPFAARAVRPAEAVIFGAKSEVTAAALPARHTPELIASCRELLPMLAPARSVLHTSLDNLGAILHPVITLLNADRITAGEPFDFYAEGVTPRVADALAEADAERLRVARAYGVAAHSLPEWVAAAYGHRASTILEAVGGNPAYVGIKAPNTLVHRYLLEDVPTGLVPLIELGHAAGLSSPTLAGLVGLAHGRLGGARWGRARTLAALGLEGLGAAAIRALVEHEAALPRAGAPVTLPPVTSFRPGLEVAI